MINKTNVATFFVALELGFNSHVNTRMSFHVKTSVCAATLGLQRADICNLSHNTDTGPTTTSTAPILRTSREVASGIPFFFLQSLRCDPADLQTYDPPGRRSDALPLSYGA